MASDAGPRPRSCRSAKCSRTMDRFGRPVGLQIVGKPRGEAPMLAAAALYEEAAGLAALVPIDPRPGTVPEGA